MSDKRSIYPQRASQEMKNNGRDNSKQDVTLNAYFSQMKGLINSIKT